METSQFIYRDKSDFLQKLNENYDHIVPINEGGGGIIYAGIHRRLGQKVVLKKMKENRIGLIGREREMQILMNLKHMYLPRILDFWSYGQDVYTVMEFIEGKSLKELLDAGVHFSEKDVIRLTRQLTEVLVYLHESPEHIIHCDIKPANIMMTPPEKGMPDEDLPSKGNICLIDFNVSQSEEDDSIGYTAGYAPVEQLISAERGRQKRLAARQAESEPEAAPTPASDLEKTMLDTELTQLDEDRTCVDDDDSTRLDDLPKAEIRPAPVPLRQKTAPVHTANPSPFAEQAARMAKKYGDCRIDARTDIYSACATMYHLLTGHKPAPCYEKQIPIETYLPDVNDALAKLLSHGMEQNPAKRFSSARQMLRSVTQLAKTTRRYKRMRFGQDLTIVLLCILFAGGLVSVYLGGTKKLENHVNAILTEAEELYLAGSYAEAETLIGEKILRSPYPVSDLRQADACRILGDCYLQTEQYTAAVGAYQTALVMGSSAPELIRDYGIALAHSGRADEAEECLAQAEILGMTSDSLLLLKGELAAARDKTAEAREIYSRCLAESEDPVILMRAGIGFDRLYDKQEMKRAEEYAMRVSMLGELSRRLEGYPQSQLPVYQRLAQVCIDSNMFAENEAHIKMAIMALDKIIDHGYGTLTEWLSRAVCAQSIGLYDKAKEQLLTASEKFPEEYLVYKRLAFLEVEIQYEKPIEERDYQAFSEYYHTCTTFYEQQTHTEQDMEMEYLKRTYEDAVSKGWLDS